MELFSSQLPGPKMLRGAFILFRTATVGSDGVPKPGGNTGPSGAWLPTLFDCNCWTLQGFRRMQSLESAPPGC